MPPAIAHIKRLCSVAITEIRPLWPRWSHRRGSVRPACVGQVSPAVTSFLWPEIITYNVLQCVCSVAVIHSLSWSLLLFSSWVRWCLGSTESSCSIYMYGVLTFRDRKKKQEWTSLLLNRFLLTWIPWLISLSSYWFERCLQINAHQITHHQETLAKAQTLLLLEPLLGRRAKETGDTCSRQVAREPLMLPSAERQNFPISSNSQSTSVTIEKAQEPSRKRCRWSPNLAALCCELRVWPRIRLQVSIICSYLTRGLSREQEENTVVKWTAYLFNNVPWHRKYRYSFPLQENSFQGVSSLCSFWGNDRVGMSSCVWPRGDGSCLDFWLVSGLKISRNCWSQLTHLGVTPSLGPKLSTVNPRLSHGYGELIKYSLSMCEGLD